MRWFYNMKIGAKLIFGFVLVAIIAGVVGVVGIYNLDALDKQYNSLYKEYGIPLGDIADVSVSYQQVRVNLRDLVIEGNGANSDTYVKSIKENEEKMYAAMEAFETSLQTEEGKAAFADLKASLEEFAPIQEQIVNYSVSGNQKEAIVLLRADESARVVSEIMSSINVLFQLKDDNGQRLSEEYSEKAQSTITTVIIIVIIAIIAAVVLGFFISRIISKPIVKMVGIAEKVSAGDLDVEIDYNARDEIGVLAEAFSRMTDNLNEVMSSINNAAEQVSAGSTQLSDSSMALSQGATEQASSIEELSASIEEIAAQTKVNAEHAKEANHITESAKMSAMEGNSQMKEMLEAMEDINEASINISKIIKVIDDIAFQTNILALNAAVEAARAGAHGKGFAVVAEEVRNLAARSANAAKETTAMIEGSVKKAEGGTKIANETAEALNKIVEGIGSVAEFIGNIAVASNEQASGIAQINQGILQVSTVVQTNSATAQESAAASEELASQAILLEEQVAKFKLKKIKKYYTHTEYQDMQSDYGKESIPSETGNEKRKNPKKIILSDKEFGKY
ncbi:methyl-accepting chemotaxis protein [Kineothrix sedimenti]|uniref:Methyl-accepting chemotaxis protein n=1 Tax=Kineothrix sedimenti TaxID=3123317 RepID=A0ABZ3F1E7_9FIRM